MTIEFKLPVLGENIDSADIVKITVSEGDKISVDQILMEIETDKANVEVPSEINGVITKVLKKDGDNVKIGDVIFTIEEEGAQLTEIPKTEVSTETKNKKEPKNEEMPVPVPAKKTFGVYEFKLPELGENIETADITKILVKIGEQVEADQPVVEIETDKATVEVPIEYGGIVKEVKIKEGDKAKIGEVILILQTDKIVEDKLKQIEPGVVKTEVSIEYKAGPETKAEEIPVQPIIISPDKISPAAPTVRRFAREIGIDIYQVNGSGPGRRISIDDVKKFAKSINEKISQTGSAFSLAAQSLPDFSKWGNIERKPMSNVRKKTAHHLSYAWSTIPHVTQFDKADITELEKLRKQFGKKAEAAGGKLTVTAIILKVIASALKTFPQFNSSVDMTNNEVIYKDYCHIGVAVDTDRGLLVPVIRDVDKKNIIELSVELSEISRKAKDKKLSLEEMQGGTFSISNLGGIGGTYFTPIVNSPEVAILGVSRGAFEQVYKEGEFVPRLMMPLSLSYDHRIIDGADGIRFLRWVISALEQPFLLSLEG